MGICCLLLQQVAVAYSFTAGDVPTSHASLVHLHAGLLLAIAMLERDLRVVAAVWGVTWLGWAMRALAFGYSGPTIAVGTAASVLMLGCTLLCAHWMGWPRARKRMRVETDDVFRFVLIGLLLYPALLTLAGSGLLSLSMTRSSTEGLVGSAVMTYFAKYFGVAIITLPLVVGWTERKRIAAWARPANYLWLPVFAAGLLLSVWLGRITRADLAQMPGDAGLVLMDYRIILLAITGWWMLHLRPALSMALLSLVLLVMAYALTGTAGYNGSALGVLNLFHLGLELGILLTAIVYFMLVGRDRLELSERLHDQANRDSLTGLPNINALRERVGSAPTVGGEMGYLLLDQVDSLATGFGLRAQAAVMNAVAARIALQAQPYYLGTGQFALVLGDADNSAQWDAMLTSIAQGDFSVDGQRLQVLPYLGVARFGPSPGGGGASVATASVATTSPETALLTASNLAFEARRTNATRPLLAVGAGMLLQQTQRQRLFDASKVLESLLRGRIELHFQPIVRLRGGHGSDTIAQPVNGEILCRLRDDEGRLVLPADFVSVIEAARRGPELDLAVIEALFRQLRAMPAMLPRCERISVNLTGQSLASDSFELRLRTLLERCPLPLSSLCLEITETAAISSISGARNLLEGLRAQGCRIAIDDFGVGMQSFARLKQLPVDIIKIDGSFVRNVTREHGDYAMVQASVAVARAIGAEVVAEFVEDEDTAACLRKLGVHWAQGYLYSRPMPLAQGLAWEAPAMPQARGDNGDGHPEPASA
ncbi:EAL domain-containing protein [Luteimonas sp. RIT-PG2_3]